MLHLGCRRPIIRSISWVNGNNIEDYRSREYHQAGAATMVRQVQRIRQASPNSRIVLIGYSAGGCVVALAAEQLPPASVDRIILLAPPCPRIRTCAPYCGPASWAWTFSMFPTTSSSTCCRTSWRAVRRSRLDRGGYDRLPSTRLATHRGRPDARQTASIPPARPALGTLRHGPARFSPRLRRALDSVMLTSNQTPSPDGGRGRYSDPGRAHHVRRTGVGVPTPATAMASL